MKKMLFIVSLFLFVAALPLRLAIAQSIVTGNATSISVVCNDVNNTTGEGPCDPAPTTSPAPSPEPTSEPTPTVPPPTPTQPPTGGGGDDGKNGDDGGGNGGGQVQGAAAEQGEVLGFAATGTAEEILFNIIGVVGAASTAFGLLLSKRQRI